MLWAFLAAPATAGEPRPGPEVERTSATLGKALLPATPESAAPARLLTDATASFFRSEETGRLGLAAPADTRLTLATRLFRQSQTRTGRLDPLAFADTVGVTDRRAGRVTMGLASADGRFSIESGLGLTGGEALSREDQLVHRLGLVPPEIGETPGSGGTAHWHSGRLRLVEREGLRLVSRFAHKSIEAGTDTAALAADLPFTDGTRSELGATLATGGVEFEALQRTDRFEARQTALSRLRAARKGMAVAFARGEEHRETPAGAFLTARDTLDLTLPARRLAAEPLGLGTLVPATLTLSGTREESAGAGTGAIAQTGQGVGLEAVWPYEGGRTRLAIRHRESELPLAAAPREVGAAELELEQRLRLEGWLLSGKMTLLEETETRGGTLFRDRTFVTGELAVSWQDEDQMKLDLSVKMREDAQMRSWADDRYRNGALELALDLDLSPLARAEDAGIERLALYGRGRLAEQGYESRSRPERDFVIGARLDYRM